MAELKYRSRVITREDILYIRELIATHPRESRRTLSKKLCEAWQWKQPNGAKRALRVLNFFQIPVIHRDEGAV